MLQATAIAADLAERGWSCCDGFVSQESVEALRAEALAARTRGEFHTAAVGAGARRVVRDAIRGDEISWLAAPTSPPLAQLLGELEQLRLALNRELMLGLFEPEVHFACYEPGRRYARHFDRLAGSDARVLSWVLYLNDDWRTGEGGSLRLYTPMDPEAPFLEFAPRGGRVVAFLSERFEHEVLPATRDRFSITGWFRRRSGP